MTKEQLVELGLEEEQIKEVFRLNGIAVNNAKEGMTKLETQIETLQGQLEVANKEIEGFKELDVEEIEKRAEDYKDKFEEAERLAKEKLEGLQFEHQLENAIRDSKARNVTAVKALLDIEKLKQSNNQIDDIKAAIELTKAENEFLFGDDEPIGTGGSMGNGSRGKGKLITKEEFEEMDYHEKRELYNTDIDLYRELAK